MNEPAVVVQSGSPAERVRQIHFAYLDCEYEVDYYKYIYTRTVRYSKHFDFAIGLGAAISGGSGLGILADPRVAWICGIITTSSVILTVAKAQYNWPAKVECALKNIEFYGKLGRLYRDVIDDLNYRKAWNEEVNKQYEKLRAERANAPSEYFPPLSVETQRSIQNQIKGRITYQTWWRPNQ